MEETCNLYRSEGNVLYELRTAEYVFILTQMYHGSAVTSLNYEYFFPNKVDCLVNFKRRIHLNV